MFYPNQLRKIRILCWQVGALKSFEDNLPIVSKRHDNKLLKNNELRDKQFLTHAI